MSKPTDTLIDIIENFDQHAQRSAVCEFLSDSLQHWSYSDLLFKINAIAGELLTRNLAPSERVILWAPNSAMWIASCLGIIRSGAIVVPVDAQLDSETFRAILRDAAPRMIICSIDRKDFLERLQQEFEIEVVYLEDLRQCSASFKDLPNQRPEDCVCVFYTSGTTGNPKGVPLKHKNILHQIDFVRDCQLATASDRLLLPLPLHHIYPFSIGMLSALALGATIVLPRGLTGPQLLRALNEGNVSVLVGVPRLYSALIAAINSRVNSLPAVQKLSVKTAQLLAQRLTKAGWRRAGRVLLASIHRQLGSNLRLLTCGGAPLETKTAESLQTLGWDLVVGYGLTETSPLVTLRLPADSNTKTVGKPLPNVEVKIEPVTEALKKETRAELAGEMSTDTGEIIVRGPNVFEGYRNQAEKNSQVLTSDGWFRTGDLGYMRDGRLFVLGRASSLIVTESGKKIDPEILEAYYAENKYIQEIGILARNGKLVAVVVPNMVSIGSQSGELTRIMHDAIDERGLHLPTYKRLSGYVLSRESLSRTAMSKIRRSKLVEHYDRIRQGFREPDEEIMQQAMVAHDRELLENARVVRVWNYFLNHYSDRKLSFDTSPQLDLGIDSLDWLNLTMEIRDYANVEIDQTMLTDLVTIRDLLEKVASNNANANNNHKTWYENPECFLSEEQKTWLSPLSNVQERISRLICHTIFLILKGLFRLDVKGIENIPKNGAFIICPNHASYLDAFVVGSAFNFDKLRTIHFAGWTGIAFANAFTRVLSRLGRVLPVDADHALVSSLAIAASALLANRGLVWFPEGRRTLTDDLLPFKPGIGLLLEHFDVPVIPVYLSGTGDALPPGSWRVRLGQKIVVNFGEPVRRSTLLVEGHGTMPHDRIADALRCRVQRIREASSKVLANKSQVIGAVAQK